jgi:chemotaxis protein MotB
MMALFIVLWLLSASEKTKKAIGGYFQDPTGNGKLAGTTQSGVGEAMQVEEVDLNSLKEKIEKAMSQQVRDFEKMKDYVNITVTEEGLRIELLENAAGMFFESGSPEPSSFGGALFSKLAEQLGVLPNLVVVEGHTDSRPFSRSGDYSNWELSTDRANAVRRLMQQHGLRGDQVTQVRGYADQQLRKPDAPEDPSNRRISILVRKMDNIVAKGAAIEPEHGAERESSVVHAQAKEPAETHH